MEKRTWVKKCELWAAHMTTKFNGYTRMKSKQKNNLIHSFYSFYTSGVGLAYALLYKLANRQIQGKEKLLLD